MKNQSNDSIRDSIIGLGENSIRKNYYPQLQKKIKEIEELNKTLEQKVEIRTKELNDVVLKEQETNEKLQHTLDKLNETHKTLIQSEKMAALGELVAGVAHEINTPIGIGLTGITYFLERTQDIQKLYSEDNISQDEFENYLKDSSEVANTINDNMVRAADLVRNFKQIAVDQSSVEKRSFNVRNYFDVILSSIKNITKKANINIIINCPTDLKINSYPGIYSQIITNLILNSIMHGFANSKNGNVSITVLKDETLKVIYTDDGKGISSENLPKIFNPFFTTARERGGTGLGLNILYNLVTNNLNGKLTCESIENKGVTFTFTDNNFL